MDNEKVWIHADVRDAGVWEEDNWIAHAEEADRRITERDALLNRMAERLRSRHHIDGNHDDAYEKGHDNGYDEGYLQAEKDITSVTDIDLESLPTTWAEWQRLDAEEKGSVLDVYFNLAARVRGEHRSSK